MTNQELYIVLPHPDKRGKLFGVEGVYADLKTAYYHAEQCGGEVVIEQLDIYTERMSNHEWVYSCGIKISTGEVSYVRKVDTAHELDPDEPYFCQVTPKNDMIYAYVWAKDEANAEAKMQEIRIEKQT